MLALLSLVLCGNLPPGPWLPQSQPGYYAWSGESTGGRQGRWWVLGQCSIPECPDSLMVPRTLFKSAGSFKYFMQRRRENL